MNAKKPARAWRIVRWCALGVLLSLVAGVLSLKIADAVRYHDDAPDRGALVMPAADALGEAYEKVVYLDQGWGPAQSLWFYNTTQGSNLLPYDFLLVLERAQDRVRFMDNEQVNRYRYLPQRPTASNPDGLPVGFVKDIFRGRAYVGLTCAACHTSQVNFRGTGIRIDGGPAGADMDGFMVDLGAALQATLGDADKRARFTDALIRRGLYADAGAAEADLRLHTTRILSYVRINRSPTPYLYGRLDAFGRIYNRVLEHLMSTHDLREALHKLLTPEQVNDVMPKVSGVLTQAQRVSLVTHLSQMLTREQMDGLLAEFFNPPDAPASYPFLWDIAQHDFVQWNGLASNGGLGPIGRNAGEVIGVFGSMHWTNQRRTSLSTFVTGQESGRYEVDFQSSVKAHNLVRIEEQLRSLVSPQWPQAVLGAIDPERSARGHRLYDRHCVSCHVILDRADPHRRVVAQMHSIDQVGTDPRLARNSVGAEGFSGILRDQYVSTGVGDVLLTRRAPAALLLTKADMAVVLTPSPDANPVSAAANRLYDYWVGFSTNPVKGTIKQGSYTPDSTAQPFASLLSYKARPLNGVWATAPYLHNGSVPTLYDLLLPAADRARDGQSEVRPSQFRVGQREFDTQRVGFRTDRGQLFDTRLPGNSNAGHDYGTVPRVLPNGKTLPALSREERLDLLEFLKTL